MEFFPERCRDEILPNGRHVIAYRDDNDGLFEAEYDSATVQREMAVQAIKRMIERK